MQEVQEQMEEEKRQERADPADPAADGQGKRARNLFMADGRPFNMNEGRLGFRLHDDRQAIGGRGGGLLLHDKHVG
jgi:hypothetical protein